MHSKSKGDKKCTTHTYIMTISMIGIIRVTIEEAAADTTGTTTNTVAVLGTTTGTVEDTGVNAEG